MLLLHIIKNVLDFLGGERRELHQVGDDLSVQGSHDKFYRRGASIPTMVSPELDLQKGKRDAANEDSYILVIRWSYRLPLVAPI